MADGNAQCEPALKATLAFVKLNQMYTYIFMFNIFRICDWSGFHRMFIFSGSVIGQGLTEHPDVRKLGFTGSTPVGKTIMER